MKRITSLLLACVFLFIQLLAQNSRPEILNEAFSHKNWKLFVDNFPETFAEFLDLYGFDDTEGTKPLYNEANDHISFIFSDARIRENQYLEKLLKLTKGYRWNADAPNYLRHHIGEMIICYPSIISEFMKDKSDDLVKDFFKSSIANPHPVPDNTGYYTSLLEKIKLYEELSPRIVLLMMVAHSELVDEWVE